MAIFNLDCINEDMSDMRSNYAQRIAMDKKRSQKGISKRPKITKDMDKGDEYDLRNYDHGNSSDGRSGVMSNRHAGSERDEYKQSSRDFYVSNKINDRDAEYYNKGNEFSGFGYKGTGHSKHSKRALKEACEYIISILDSLD